MGEFHSGIVVTIGSGNLSNSLEPGEVRLDRALGRPVVDRTNHSIGRLEEVRADMRGNSGVITEYVIGVAGLLERLGVGARLLFGRQGGGHIARWDQIDIRDPDHPRLTCALTELRKF